MDWRPPPPSSSVLQKLMNIEIMMLLLVYIMHLHNVKVFYYGVL